MKKGILILVVLVLLAAWLWWTPDDNEEAEPMGIVGSFLGKLGAGMEAVADVARKLSPSREASKREIARAVEQYRGGIPFGTLMAICEHESGFNPDAYNPREVGSIGHARGPWQIMDGYQADYGVDASTVTDIDASTRGTCRVRGRSHDLIMSLCPEAANDLRDYTYLLYLAHFAGNGGLEKKIKQAQARGAGVTADTVGGYGHEAGLKAVADRAASWEAQRDTLLAEVA
jgi:hypothetical protein